MDKVEKSQPQSLYDIRVPNYGLDLTFKNSLFIAYSLYP